jgi:hypothetical protein
MNSLIPSAAQTPKFLVSLISPFFFAWQKLSCSWLNFGFSVDQNHTLFGGEKAIFASDIDIPNFLAGSFSFC